MNLSEDLLKQLQEKLSNHWLGRIQTDDTFFIDLIKRIELQDVRINQLEVINKGLENINEQLRRTIESRGL